MTENGELLTEEDNWISSAYAVCEIETMQDFKHFRTTTKYKYYIKDSDMLYRIPAKPELLGGGSRIQINWNAMSKETYLLGYHDDNKKMIAVNEETGEYFHIYKDIMNNGVSMIEIVKSVGVSASDIKIITRKETH